MNMHALAEDLIRRTESAVESVSHLAVDTGITFKIEDIVQSVEDHLPANYPAPAAEGVTGRREMIKRMAKDILSGEMYEA